jgi:hypothetical protein
MIVVVAWVDRRLLWLSLLGFLDVGCVSLDKPDEVQACSAAGTCSNSLNKVPTEDARRDVTSAPADLPSDRSGKPDLAPDTATPDLGKDNGTSNSFFGGEDLAPDKSSATESVNGPEPGPEPSIEPASGPEPSTGAEPRPEPSMRPESGPESGPEPGPDPGREPAPEPLPDAGTSDLPPASNCAVFYGTNPLKGAAGQPPSVDTLSSFCIATCDDIDGWGCANFAGRTISVNGTDVSCGATLTKKNGYYVFRASAGTLSYATIYWWGPRASTCPAPADGVFP